MWKINAPAGNWTRIQCLGSIDDNHYTTSEILMVGVSKVKIYVGSWWWKFGGEVSVNSRLDAREVQGGRLKICWAYRPRGFEPHFRQFCTKQGIISEYSSYNRLFLFIKYFITGSRIFNALFWFLFTSYVCNCEEMSLRPAFKNQFLIVFENQ